MSLRLLILIPSTQLGEPMCALTLALVSAVLMAPKEYHIDCSSWTGAMKADFDIRITAMDGTVLKTGIVVQPGAKPEHVCNAIETLFKSPGWQFRRASKNIIVLQGSQKSPIKSVEFKSKDWKPDVRVMLNAPDKK